GGEQVLAPVAVRVADAPRERRVVCAVRLPEAADVALREGVPRSAEVHARLRIVRAEQDVAVLFGVLACRLRVGAVLLVLVAERVAELVPHEASADRDVQYHAAVRTRAAAVPLVAVLALVPVERLGPAQARASVVVGVGADLVGADLDTD